MKFLDDKILQRVEIGQTCERCSNLDCLERTVPATLFLNKKMEEKKLRKIVELSS